VSVNKAIIIGRLGADPEVRFTQNGQAVANFNVATDEVWTDKSGQRQERVEWHRIVVWGKQAELCGEYLRKGREAYIEGRIETREWQDRDGNRRWTTEIKAQNVRFLGGRGGDNYNDRGGSGGQQNYGGGGSQAPGPQGGGPQGGQPQGGNNTSQDAGPPGAGFDDDEIPF